jgi:hypothetical protein
MPDPLPDEMAPQDWEMLAWRESKKIGQNRTRFGEFATAMLAVPEQPQALSLLQHN